MKSVHQNKLYRRFPLLFAFRHSPYYSIGQHGIECGTGWFQVLWKLCDRLNQLKEVPHILRICEKHGLLHFQIAPLGTDEQLIEALELIEKAELASSDICEICSSPGRLIKRNGYVENWMRVRCPEHIATKRTDE